MAAEDQFDAVVVNAIRACSLPSVDSNTTNSDDASLLTHGFDELGFDSLSYMEFCISVHLNTGVEMDIDKVQSLKTPLAVVEFLRRSQ
jgi:acyl carrier protein